MSEDGDLSLQDEWDYLYKGGDLNTKAIEKALNSELHLTRLRHLGWMKFLGIVEGDTEGWRAQIQAKRDRFEQLKKYHIIDPKASKDEDDLKVFNPLSTAKDSPWVRYFENKELEKVIWQDILRTYPDKEFFQQKWVQDLLLRCLFLFAKENGATGYRQGMHELCSIILLLVEREKLSKEALAEQQLDPEGLLSFILDREFLDHDTFMLFEALMVHTNPWFEIVDTRGARGLDKNGEFIADRQQAEERAISSAPIIVRCRRIQNQYLKKADAPLCNYLHTLGIEPQLYALKWLRLMFGREFHFDDVMILWDAILAHGKDFALVDHIAVSMLIFMREHIIGKEYTEAMGRLMKFPPVEDINSILEKSLNYAIPGRKSRPKASAPVTQPHIEPIGETAVFRPSSAAVASSGASITIPGNLRSAVETLGPSLERLQLAHTTLAGHIVATLQRQLLADECDLGGNLDTVLMSLAELKQVKDVLNGSLDLEDAMFIGQEEENQIDKE